MTLTPEAHTAVERLNIDELDALIAVTYSDITWHSPTFAHRAWEAIDQLLDRRLQLTNSHNSTMKQPNNN